MNREDYQMGKYKIQIKVDLVECSDDSKEYELRKENNGSSMGKGDGSQVPMHSHIYHILVRFS